MCGYYSTIFALMDWFCSSLFSHGAVPFCMVLYSIDHRPFESVERKEIILFFSFSPIRDIRIETQS
jgi:hypothetical protein